VKKKIALFCDTDVDGVVEARDADVIYALPLIGRVVESLSDENATAAARGPLIPRLWGAARELFVRSLEILRDLRDRGVLNSEELTEIDAISQKIADCDLFLAK